jgi:hypothetical protein
MPEFLRPPASEITSPLVEHITSLTFSVRGHLIALFNDREDDVSCETHFGLALKALEEINKLVEPDLFTSKRLKTTLDLPVEHSTDSDLPIEGTGYMCVACAMPAYPPISECCSAPVVDSD